MITLFQADETIFSHDGVEVLDDIVISSYTSWGENGKWVSESKFKKDYDKSESIKEGMILQLPTEKGLQLFRILKLNKKNKKYITTTGQHIAFDFENNFIQDINIVEKSGRAAIKQIQGGTVFNSKYNLTSNIDTVASARMVRKNGITSLVGSDDNCFINRWGGYLVLDNFNISMNTSVGQDRGVEVLIGKNLTDMEGSIDISSVVTGINPITYDGLTLPEGIYYSPLVNNYPEPRIKEFKFDDIKYKYSENNYDEEGYETLEEVYEAIRKACDDLYNNSNIDKPTCNLRVSIIDLTKTDQYKGIELNERIFQGDIVTANLEEYGFNVKLKMTANKYNNIKDCYEDFDLGDVKTNVFSSIGKIQSTVDKVIEQLGGNTWQDILDKSMKEATELIEAGIKGSYVVARKNEILIMDSPNVESAINVIRMNKNGIAFSQNGYNGPYTLAITIDGKINASCITTGELNASLIKTGVLMSANGQTWIDMNNGSFNFANNLTMDEEGNIVYKGTITGSYADLRDTLLINGKGGNGWAQILLRSSTGLEGNIYTGGEKSLNMFAPSGIYIGGYRAVLEDEDDKWKMWTTDGGKGKAIFFDAVNGKIYSEGMPLTLSALGGRVQTETNFYVKGSCNPISHATGGMDLGASNLRWYTLYCVTAINTSDKRYKKNIKYLDEDNRVPVSNFSSRTSSVNKDEYKYYDFIKNELKLAEYDYDRQDSTYRVEDHQIGFIAQDIINTEIGEKFCYELEEGLGFSATGYTSIIAKALQEAIQKIESLEKEIELLKTQQ